MLTLGLGWEGAAVMEGLIRLCIPKQQTLQSPVVPSNPIPSPCYFLSGGGPSGRVEVVEGQPVQNNINLITALFTM